MDNVGHFVRFVKAQKKRVLSIIEKHPEDKRAEGSLRPVCDNYDKLADFLVQQEDQITTLRAEIAAIRAELHKRSSTFDNLEVSPKDLIGLPDELISQLSVSEYKNEFKLLEMIEEAGGTMTLDQLLIAIYKSTGEIQDRAKLNARLYRMAKQRGMLYSVPNRTGTYTIYRPESGGQEEIDEDLLS